MKRKLACITGASRGIGYAAAEKFAENGYDLFLNCLENIDLLRAAKAKFESEYNIRCDIFAGDMGEENVVKKMFLRLRESTDRVDVLVNNAGVSYYGLLADMSSEEWRRVMSSNLDSVFYVCREAIPLMLNKRSGKIINVSSVWGMAGSSCETAYSASKGGVNGFTKALAKELAPSNIQVNAIACGMIDTEMNGRFTPDEIRELKYRIPSGYFASPEDVAEIIFEIGGSNKYLTGQIINFDGGWI